MDKKEMKKILDEVSKKFLNQGNAYNDIEWSDETFEFDCEDEKGETWFQDVECWTYSPYDAMYRIPKPFIELIIKEAQKEIILELIGVDTDVDIYDKIDSEAEELGIKKKRPSEKMLETFKELRK